MSVKLKVSSPWGNIVDSDEAERFIALYVIKSLRRVYWQYVCAFDKRCDPALVHSLPVSILIVLLRCNGMKRSFVVPRNSKQSILTLIVVRAPHAHACNAFDLLSRPKSFTVSGHEQWHGLVEPQAPSSREATVKCRCASVRHRGLVTISQA